MLMQHVKEQTVKMPDWIHNLPKGTLGSQVVFDLHHRLRAAYFRRDDAGFEEQLKKLDEYFLFCLNHKDPEPVESTGQRRS